MKRRLPLVLGLAALTLVGAWLVHARPNVEPRSPLPSAHEQPPPFATSPVGASLADARPNVESPLPPPSAPALQPPFAGADEPRPYTESAGDALRARLAAAPAGAVITVAPGVYAGPFVLDRPVALRGEPGAILDGGGTGHVVTVTAPDVEVSGFRIRRSGRELGADHAAIHVSGDRARIIGNRILDCLHGIYVKRAEGAFIADNVITGDGAAVAAVSDPLVRGLMPGQDELCGIPTAQDRRGNGIHLWNSAGHLIARNTITGTRDGVYFSFTDRTRLEDNVITGVRYGLHYMYSDENVFVRNTFRDSAAGAALMYSKQLELRDNRFLANRSQRAYGLLLQSVDDTVIAANRIEGNTLGLYLENGNANRVTGNLIAANYVGVRVSDSSAANVFAGNRFVQNLHPVETSGANAANAWSEAGRGNRWEGAITLDLDRNGVADVPHHEVDLFGRLRRDFPAIGLLSASPGERLLRFIQGRIGLRGRARVTDPAPLVSNSSTPLSP